MSAAEPIMSRRAILMRAVYIVLSAVGLLCGYDAIIGSAAAQFFDDRYPFFEERRRGGSRDYGPRDYYGPRDFFGRDNPNQRPQQPADWSKAPPPTRKPDATATKTVVVFGDSMGDWLAYGLEEAFAETPEVGIVRKHRTVSGLIRSETRNDSYDWVQAARDILAGESADFIVMMIGPSDRQPIRERIVRNPPQQQSAAQQPARGAQAPAQPQAQQSSPAPADAERGPDDQPSLLDSPSIIANESASSAGLITHEFRSERWAELYTKRIDDVIAVLKSKGVPVYWVGLPAIRGARSTSDIAYLNDMYRSRAERAGIMYVDVWDGFVDDNGNFAAQGPDVEGQIRRLRTADGVHFTKAGARKLAHYVEREIQRALVARPVLVSLPTPEEPQPDAKPGTPAGRPAAGPIIYLTGAPPGGEELLGGATGRTPSADPTATRVLVKGEPLSAPAGRADDFAWPRREIGVASVSNITEPAVPEPPGSTRSSAALPAPAAVKPTQRQAQPGQPGQPAQQGPFGSRVANQRQAPPTFYQQQPSRSFWPFGGLFR